MSDHSPVDATAEARLAYRRRWEAVETAKAQELWVLSDERARAIIMSLSAAQAWRARSDWSGLVEQQAILKRARRR